MTAEPLSEQMTVVAAAGCISSNLEEEEVILNLETGVYYGLNPVGARIWALIQQPRAIADICATLVDEYDVEPARCRQDALDLLTQLADAQLIEVAHVTVADPSTTQMG
ncbi:MAG: PqqD family peptide modification chaperone [Armatimonadota bacterium]